jgi:hypothetical protein
MQFAKKAEQFELPAGYSVGYHLLAALKNVGTDGVEGEADRMVCVEFVHDLLARVFAGFANRYIGLSCTGSI